LRILLDTCTFLWALSGSSQLSKRIAEAIRDRENEAYLSAASAMEISVKVGLGKLPLPGPPETFVPQARRALGVELLEIDEESALRVGGLPPLHRDPFDRLLISQAITHGLILATPDPQIQQYPIRWQW
jgi:PIN domain nuclease of toxin-antitoxin system